MVAGVKVKVAVTSEALALILDGAVVATVPLPPAWRTNPGGSDSGGGGGVPLWGLVSVYGRTEAVRLIAAGGRTLPLSCAAARPNASGEHTCEFCAGDYTVPCSFLCLLQANAC